MSDGEQIPRDDGIYAARNPWTSVNRRNCGWKNIPAERVYFTVNLCEPNMGRASPNSFIVRARSFPSSWPLNGSKNHFSRDTNSMEIRGGVRINRNQ